MKVKEQKKKGSRKDETIYLRNIDSVVFFSRIAAATDEFETGSGSSHVSFLTFVSLNLFFALTFYFRLLSLTLATMRDKTVLYLMCGLMLEFATRKKTRISMTLLKSSYFFMLESATLRSLQPSNKHYQISTLSLDRKSVV